MKTKLRHGGPSQCRKLKKLQAAKLEESVAVVVRDGVFPLLPLVILFS